MNERVQPRKRIQRNPRNNKRLGADIISIHNKPGKHSFTFSQEITAKALKDGKTYVFLGNAGEGMPYEYIIFTTDSQHKEYGLVGNKGRQNGQLNSNEMVRIACSALGIIEGDSRVRVEEIKAKTPETHTIYKLAEVVDTMPLNITVDQGNLFDKEPTLSAFTDQQLYDELKRRGYEGKLTKTSTLE